MGPDGPFFLSPWFAQATQIIWGQGIYGLRRIEGRQRGILEKKPGLSGGRIEMNSLTVRSKSPKETHSLGQMLSGWLEPGDVINLVGELGAGKTVLVKGIATGLDIDDTMVTSPTFSLINEYTARVPLYHFDAYRIERPEEWEDLGYEEYFRGNGISVVEWGNLVEDYLPPEYLRIVIEKQAMAEDHRGISLTAVGDRFGALIGRLQEEMEHAGLGDRYGHEHRQCCAD